jgi:hypothetical protein
MVGNGGSDGVGGSEGSDEIGSGTSTNESLGVRELPESLETVVTSPVTMRVSDRTRWGEGEMGQTFHCCRFLRIRDWEERPGERTS